MKKTIFMMLAAFTLSVGAQAQDKVVVNKKDGGKQAYEMEKISKITFQEDAYTIVGKDNSDMATVSYADTKTITFELVDGIEQIVNTERGKMKIIKQGNTITVEGFNGNDGRVAIFSLDGTMMQSNNAWRGDAISVESLPAGIYVININGQSLKFTKQ